MAAVDAYLAQHGLWGDDPATAGPLDFTRLYAGLVQHRRLTPGQVADLTLTEALLYTVPLEESDDSADLQTVGAKLKVLATLPVADHLALARIRSGR